MIETAGAGGKLEDYYLFHAARADLLRRLERFGEAHSAYGRALFLSTKWVEQNYNSPALAELL